MPKSKTTRSVTISAFCHISYIDDMSMRFMHATGSVTARCKSKYIYHTQDEMSLS